MFLIAQKQLFLAQTCVLSMIWYQIKFLQIRSSVITQPFCEKIPTTLIMKDERFTQGLARLQYLLLSGSIAVLYGQTGVGKSTLLKLFFSLITLTNFSLSTSILPISNPQIHSQKRRPCRLRPTHLRTLPPPLSYQSANHRLY